MDILAAAYAEQYSWMYWAIAVFVNLLICFGCWWLARESGRNGGYAILWGLLCGLLALLVYLFLWAKDTGGKVRRKPGQYDQQYLRDHSGGAPGTPDPYYTGAPDAPYPAHVRLQYPFSYDDSGAVSYCPRCGAPQEPGSEFCRHCGERIPAAGQPITAAPQQYPPPAAGAPPPAPPPASHQPPDKPKPSEWK